MRPSIAVISTAMGGFDKKQNHVKQSVPADYVHFNDENFPLRVNSMGPRLQARIPKMFAWQMVPDYDYYLWVDSSCRLSHEDSIKWFREQLGDKDIVVFKHPHRSTVQEEADYLRERLALEASGKKQKYILPRYEFERLDDQMAVVEPNDPLFATTALMYKNDTPTRDLMAIWWLHTSLYHTNEQLSLATALRHSGATHNVIPDNYLNIKYLEYVRNK